MSKATKADTPQKVNYNDAVAESKKYFDEIGRAHV